ncbi:PH domain-containing protein [Halomicroarcula sp. S1AR25-4]|uniref:PH domain-containing protein n=1 Tax=Haloarcula sp. S1AR25-4 TaxID=2950538 RepID=UPI002875E53F|nr:PH domain-containing protein [Halomicroarcula sp. S1AR25-4]MDS0276408.1 PH domain-containing protein [Halomicroarcula sp. S1AR25-4]
MRRLHPRSAVRRVGRAVVQGAVFGFFVGTALAGTIGLPSWVGPALAPLGATVTGGFALVRYYRFRYAITGGTLAVESGVFARQSREIPLGRIQNVDLRQGVVNRLLGLTVVDFETAGGSTTEASLDAVAPEEADRLRRLVQRYGRDSDERDAATTETSTDEPAGSGPTEHDEVTDLFAFSWRDLLTYAVVSVRPAAPVLTLAGLPLGGDLVAAVVRFNLTLVGAEPALTPSVLETFGPPRLVALALLTLVQFLLTALLVSVVLTVVEYYDFRLFREGDDLRYQRGLVRRYSGTIPLSKVQTVTVKENVLMRRFGLATLVVETAGYSGGNQQSAQGVAVPMAPREEVYELARDIEPFGTFEFERPPTRARRRYAFRFAFVAAVLTGVGYAVDTFGLGTGFWWVLLGLFVLVPPAAHFRWRHRGFVLDDDVLATRSGFWSQTTRIVPYYRVQTVFVGRSPFQRRRDLATVTADTASTASIFGGSATVYDVDEATASDLRAELRRRLYTDLLARKRARLTASDNE